MLCNKCNKIEATIHLSQINGDKRTTLDLCQDCADEVSEAADHKIEQEIDTMLNEPMCECGMTLEKIAELRKLGCPQCYETFETQLEAVLLRTHGATKHVGRVPRVSAEVMESSRKAELTRVLNAEMKLAVSEERYERAAEIRDQLKEINENKVYQG